MASAAVAGLSHGKVASSNVPLGVMLLSLDSSTYRVGDKLVCEIEVKNTGTQIVEFPWDPSITDVEPSQERSYEYDAAALSLSFFVSGNQIASLPPVTLYGLASRPHSLLKLAPGKWARLRLKWALVFKDAAFMASLTTTRKVSTSVKANVQLTRVRVSLHDGSYHEQIVASGPPIVSAEVNSIELVSSSPR